MARKPKKRQKPVKTRHKQLPSGDIEPIKPGLLRVKRYRDKKTGRFTSKPKRITKRYQEESYEYRTKIMGQFTSGRIVPTEDTETKRLGTIDLDNWQGHIKSAMMASNVFTTAQNRDAQMVDIFLQGYDGKTRIVIKKSLDLRDISKRYTIGDLMIGKIVERLHSMGYRTQYDLKTIKWSRLATTKREASALTPLKNVTVTFRVRY